MEPRNRFQGIDSASLCSLAGWYDNPLPPQFLAPFDSLKIPTLYNNPIPNRFLDCSKVPAPCCYFKQSVGTRNRVGIGLLYRPARARICKPFKEPGIDSQPGGPVRQPYLLYRLARLQKLAESIPRNRFLDSLKV